jgi:hypothetical protein
MEVDALLVSASGSSAAGERSHWEAQSEIHDTAGVRTSTGSVTPRNMKRERECDEEIDEFDGGP